MNLKGDFKKLWKKFWFLLWKDDSWKGWIFSIIFLFVFIKFLFFPALSLVTGTSLPLAIVESCSMYHKGNLFSDFDAWWEDHESKYSEFTINKLDFQDFKLKNGFNKGDILFIIKADPEKLKVGDVIIFEAGTEHPVIHRIVKISETDGSRIFSTMGDNVGNVQSFEEEITQDRLIGKAVIKAVPYMGWIKLALYEWKKPESKRGLCNER